MVDRTATEKTNKTSKPFAKLIEDAVISLKEVEQQLGDPFAKCKLLVATVICKFSGIKNNSPVYIAESAKLCVYIIDIPSHSWEEEVQRGDNQLCYKVYRTAQ